MLSLPIRSAQPDESAQRRFTQLFPAPTALPAGGQLSAPPTAPPTAPGALAGPGAFDPGRRGFRALAAVAAVVVAVAAFLAWQARPQMEPAGPVTAATGLSALAPPTRTEAAGSPSLLVVAVAGRVRRPGLVGLAPGARVADAIQAAGGVLPGTDLTAVNLARKVIDGELIAIGVPGLPAGGGPGPDGAGPGGQVNLNTATVAQLDSLPGVGPVLAQRILDYRTRHGAFGSREELRKVEGIGQAKYEQIKDLVVV